MAKKFLYVWCSFGLLWCKTSVAQGIGKYDTIKVHIFITPQGDTILTQRLPDVTVFTKLSKRQRQRNVEWTRLRNAVYVTYPYAVASAKIINDINAKLVGVTDKKKRKAIIRSREKELKKEFADKLTNLSIYQGKVLMKLIFRETGNNCYEIIEEYKGLFTAIMWQGIALLFGNNLKQNYDPLNADREMETIVKDVQKMYGFKG